VRQIASLLSGMTWEELLAFFDDVLVFSTTLGKHCESLDRVLTIIEKAGLKVKVKVKVKPFVHLSDISYQRKEYPRIPKRFLQ